jgi:uncharacterized protein (DUF2062 family)
MYLTMVSLCICSYEAGNVVIGNAALGTIFHSEYMLHYYHKQITDLQRDQNGL